MRTMTREICLLSTAMSLAVCAHAEVVNYDCDSFEPYVDCEVVEEKVASGTLTNADCLGILDYVQNALNRDVCCLDPSPTGKRLNLDDAPNPPVPPWRDDSIENNACAFLNPINGGSQFSIDIDPVKHCTGLACNLDCSSRAFSLLDDYQSVAVCNRVREQLNVSGQIEYRDW